MAQLPPPEAKPLPSPPTDGITALSFLPKSSSHLLASTSWDGSVRLHDTTQMSAVLSYPMDSGPLLSLAAQEDSLLTGGLDGSIRKLDIATSSALVVGRHSDGEKNACSCLASLGDSSSLVASAGWDSRFHLWDMRTTSGTTTTAPVSSITLPGKAFAMDFDPTHSRMVVATAGRRICFLDIRSNRAELVLDRESSLKYQTRTVKFFPRGVGIALGSIEGRVAVEFLDDLGIQSDKTKYAFKCHRVGDTVYPVNCIDFHPKFGTFCTGGCDRTVVIWDGWNKKKLTALPRFPTSIAALAFNEDGSQLAIASSYTFEEGEREHARDEIYVRQMLDFECQPKTMDD